MTAAPRLPEIAIRSARTEEAEVVAVLLYESVHGLGDYMFGCESRWPVLKTLEELFRSRRNRLSLGALFRMAWRSLALPGPEALCGEYYVSNLAFLPSVRGRGIGSRLLAIAEGQARSMGLARLSLCVDLDNTGAQRLYRRTGYQIAQNRAYARRAAQAGRGYLRMVKQLDPWPAS